MDGMKPTAFLNRGLHFKATSADLFTMVYYYGLLQLIYLLFLETLCCTSAKFQSSKEASHNLTLMDNCQTF